MNRHVTNVVHTLGAVTTQVKQGVESHYYLLGKEDSKADEREDSKMNLHHKKRNGDYEDPDEEEWENVYHVLEGPTPEQKEKN